MKRLVSFLAYGAAVLTVVFALALPIKVFPAFLSVIRSLDLKIAPWFSGGEAAFVLDQERYQITVFHPVYPALVGEGEKGFVQLVWRPRSILPAQVHDSLDLDRDGSIDCDISFSNPGDAKTVPTLTVVPRSPWVLPVQNSTTLSLESVLIEKGRNEIFVRIPVKKKIGPQ